MRIGNLSRIVRVTGLALAFGLFAMGVARADTPDGWVTMKTKIALMTADGVSAGDLNVDTVKGVVTLHGKVKTEAERSRAEEVARRVDGAREVHNLLQVVPKYQREVVERSDDAIKESVEAAFKANHRISSSGIHVASVNKGVVLLSGRTTSLEAQMESVQVADAVRGVRHVSSEVRLEPSN